MILKLEHTTTHQTYEYEVSDMNNGEKLYFRFDINTLNLDEGEYNLSLYDEGNVVCSDILKIGDYNPNSLQYRKGENTYINVTLENTIQGDKKVNINAINTTIKPDSGYNTMSSVEVNAQELFDEAFEEGNKIGFQDGKTIGEEIGYINGKEDGINVGIEEQKSKLEPIAITENGTYTREDGYSEVVVNVEDANGSFDDGFSSGYQQGYDEGLNEGTTNAGEIIAETARVLNITKNGTYYSKYSDVPEDEPLNVVKDGEYTYTENTGEITGYFDDGTPFYGCAQLYNQAYNTNITVTQDSVIELWYKGDNQKTNDGWNTIFGCAQSDDTDFYLGYMYSDNTRLRGFLGGKTKEFTWDDTIWHHIIMKNDGLWIDDVLIGSFNSTKTFAHILDINGTWQSFTRNANGCFGMIKIDDVVIIPTENDFVKLNKIIPEGNLIKTVTVNVLPALNANNMKLNFGYSGFEKIPDGLINWSKITNMDKMFMECNYLKDLGNIDTSNVTSMNSTFTNCIFLSDFSKLNLSNVTNLSETFRNTQITDDVIANFDTSNVENFNGAFYNCSNIKIFPSINTSKAKDFSNMFNGSMNLEEVMPIDTSKATTLAYMFYSFSEEHKLRKLPEFDCTNVNVMSNMFSYYQDRMDYFTDCGGWNNLKCKWDDNYGLRACANLTYQSCINILNGLYDFTGNGETPTSSQGKLKVHQNFLDLVGDEISIGTSRGWLITA